MKKIAWMSRHHLNAAQLAALRELFGEVEINMVDLNMDMSRECCNRLTDLFDTHDHVVGVFPVHVAGAIVGNNNKRNGEPLRWEIFTFENSPERRADGGSDPIRIWRTNCDGSNVVWSAAENDRCIWCGADQGPVDPRDGLGIHRIDAVGNCSECGGN